MKPKNSVSVVTTMYRSKSYVKEFASRIKRELLKNNIIDYELIFVDDGCPQESYTVVDELCRQDEKVKLVKFSRNFGHHHAMMMGISETKKDHVFLIDIDLEEEPENFSLLWEKYCTDDSEVVFGIQKERKGSIAERYLARGYNALLGFTSTQYAKNATVSRIMSRRYCDQLARHWDKNLIFSQSLIATGFKQDFIIIDKKNTSETTYSMSSKLIQAVQQFILAGDGPLLLLFVVSAFQFLMTIFIVGCVLVGNIFGLISTTGWSSVIMSLWLLGSLNVMFFSLCVVMIKMTLKQVTGHPAVVVERRTNFDE